MPWKPSSETDPAPAYVSEATERISEALLALPNIRIAAQYSRGHLRSPVNTDERQRSRATESGLIQTMPRHRSTPSWSRTRGRVQTTSENAGDRGDHVDGQNLVSCGARPKRSESDRTSEGRMPVSPPPTLGTRIWARDLSRTILVEPSAGSDREESRRGFEAVSEDWTGERAEVCGELVPRFSGLLLGVRQWLVPDSLDELKPLRTLKESTPSWETDGSATEARCFSDGSEFHEPPGKGCECGLRAYHPWLVPPWYLHSGDKAVMRTGDKPMRVEDRYLTGVVEAWGRIELYPEGLRAQFARPVALVLPPALRIDAGARRALMALCDRADAELIDPDRPGSLEEAPPQGMTDHPDQHLTRIALAAWFERAQGTDVREVLERLQPPEA